MYVDVIQTFLASLRSVGTACTMASVGFYLHRRDFIVGEGKRTLALISQQVTIPAFLFSKIVYCNQDWSDKPCPNVTNSLDDVWLLLFWPIYVVGCGFLVGWVVSELSNTPKWQRKSVLAACAFGNSTGLPITLLTVIHANFPSTTELGRVDPTLFLSVYLLLYPVLQWGMGGWLLAPGEDDEEEEEEEPKRPKLLRRRSSRFENVLNNKITESAYFKSRRGMGETDASLYISSADLQNLEEEHLSLLMNTLKSGSDAPSPTGYASIRGSIREEELDDTTDENRNETDDDDEVAISETCSKIATRCLQPPVVGAILGLFVASTPLRGVFVDLVNRADRAPLQWAFDGIYSVGQAAVPLNMIILGCNLSASSLSSTAKEKLLCMKTMVAMVVGKMMVMPLIGVVSAVVLKKYVLDIPEDINASFFLVAMIVFITPTANNVMVMVELSGGGTKEGIARVIGLQYVVAPVLLSLTVTLVVGIASQWS